MGRDIGNGAHCPQGASVARRATPRSGGRRGCDVQAKAAIVGAPTRSRDGVCTALQVAAVLLLGMVVLLLLHYSFFDSFYFQFPV